MFLVYYSAMIITIASIVAAAITTTVIQEKRAVPSALYLSVEKFCYKKKIKTFAIHLQVTLFRSTHFLKMKARTLNLFLDSA